MSKFLTCRLPGVSAPTQHNPLGLCLIATVDGKHCQGHVGKPERDLAAFMAKPIERKFDKSESEETAAHAAERRSHWPFWP